MKTNSARNRPEGINQIHEAASKLVKPTLTHLYQVFLDQKAAAESERSDLLRQQENIRQEGFEAAIRLRISCSDAMTEKNSSYFKLLEHKEK